MICFFFNDTATTEIYTLSLHDALPIYSHVRINEVLAKNVSAVPHGISFPDMIELYNDGGQSVDLFDMSIRSEEHTSELQSQSNLVCRLLLEKKNQKILSCSSRY